MNNKAAKGTWAAAFTVGSVWFGTHVGGGFASGNQVVSYFAQYGMWAAVLPIIAMGILALVMYTVMKFAKLNGFTNYKDTFSAPYPKPWMPTSRARCRAWSIIWKTSTRLPRHLISPLLPPAR